MSVELDMILEMEKKIERLRGRLRNNRTVWRAALDEALAEVERVSPEASDVIDAIEALRERSLERESDE